MMTRWLKAIVGIGFVAFGVLWTLQGLNVVQGSFMSGQTMWLVTLHHPRPAAV